MNITNIIKELVKKALSNKKAEAPFLSNKIMKEMIPLFVDDKSLNSHNCKTCFMRIGNNENTQCTIIDREIKLSTGTCNYWASTRPDGSSTPSTEKDIKESRMPATDAGYIEYPGDINCSTCVHGEEVAEQEDVGYCKLWSGRFYKKQCCMAWRAIDSENERLNK